MSGYIANTDSAWFKFLTEHRISNPVFWFKREANPNSKSIVAENYMFLRITGTNPPVIKAFGTISQLGAMTVQEAFDRYGHRLGYESITSMIEYSSAWTSSVTLSPRTRIFCVEIDNLRHTRDVRVDRELEPLGILFDYRHIVTGKGLTAQQTSALLQHVQVASQGPVASDKLNVQEIPPESETDGSPEEEVSTESARYLESHMQWFVFNNLQCLGIPGIRLYEPEVHQETQGKYRTDEVGELDFLLRSSSNDLYVVELKKAGTDKTVGQICRYMGWVKHRLAKHGETVFGIIVTQDYDDRLSYAATVVSNLSVRRVQISFTVTSEEPDLPE